MVLFFHFLDGFDTRLHQICESGFGSEAGYKLINFFAATFILYPGFFIDFFILSDLIVIFGGIAGNFTHPSAMDTHGVGNKLIHKTSVVGNQHEFVGPSTQILLDPANGCNIQEVGWLI